MTVGMARERVTPVVVGLMAVMLTLVAASNSYAAPRGGDKGELLRPPQTIKAPPGPQIRDHRGATGQPQGGVTVTSKPRQSCGGFFAACLHASKERDHRRKPRPVTRDHRSK